MKWEKSRNGKRMHVCFGVRLYCPSAGHQVATVCVFVMRIWFYVFENHLIVLAPDPDNPPQRS